MGEQVRILVVDDELHVRTSLSIWLREEGYHVSVASSGKEALELASREPPDILMVDIKMPGMDGLELHRRMRRLVPDATVILMTAYAAVDTAVQALKDGAFDYIVKPFDPEHVSRLVKKAADRYRLVGENRELRDRMQAALPPVIAAEGSPMAAVLEQADKLAPTEAHLIIIGEPGVGKELVARRIHARSRRAFAPLVVVDCSASGDTVEDDLFGSDRESLPASLGPHKGKLALAHEGTLVLRAIDDAPLRVQEELSHALVAGKITRGDQLTLELSFRLLATSNQDVEVLAEQGRFDLELYNRLRGCRIEIPPLRVRPDDIPLLAQMFAAGFATKVHRDAVSISSDAMAALRAHAWPGNVRELKNAMEHAVAVCNEGPILPEHLPFAAGPRAGSLTLAHMEEIHIRHVLEMYGQDFDRAAAELGIDRPTLENKLASYELGRT